MNLKLLTIIIIVLFADWIRMAGDQTAIRSDHQKGALSVSQYLYYTFLDLYAPEELPECYRTPPTTARRSRFGLIGELKNRLDEVAEPYRSRIRSVLSSRPSGLPNTFISPSGHFMIHYTTTGYHAVDTRDSDANGIPDYVDQVGRIFDRVYRIEIDSLGYRHYKEDNIDGSQLDVYIQNLGGDYGGCAWDETTCRQCTPFITIDNDYAESSYSTHGLEAVRVTAAHEFFHALQLNYRWDPGVSSSNIYWYEISSTWMEDVIEDSVNDYLSYLKTYYANTNSSLTTFDGYSEYSKVPWTFYMAESYSPDIIRQLWEDYSNPGYQPHQSFDHVLPEGFATNFIRFAYWNTFTGTQAVADSFFSEGSHYPELTIPDWGGAGIRDITIQPLAIQYYHYIPEGNGGIRLHNDPLCDGFIKGIQYNGSHHTHFFNSSSGSVLFPNLSLYRHLIIALVNPTSQSINRQVRLEFDSSLYDVALINGRVTDRSGKGIEQAAIELHRSSDHRVMVMTQSGSAGSFSLPIPDSLIHQNLNLRVEMAGYEIMEWKDFRAEEWLDSLLTILLNPLSNRQIGAWPNPFQNQLSFGYFEAYQNPEVESYQVQLYTLDGQIIYQDTGEAAFNRIEIPSRYLEPLSSGVYLFYLKLGPLSRRGKIIKTDSD